MNRKGKAMGKVKYQILESSTGGFWETVKKAVPQPSGWLHYESFDGTNGLKRPGTWRVKPIEFSHAMRILPSCLVGALDNPTTLSDLRVAAQHEIDMFSEGQDGCLSRSEIIAVKDFLTMLG